MSKRISQREARQLRKDVRALRDEEERRRRWWATEWPNGIQIANIALRSDDAAAIRTARKLGHAVVVVTDSNSDTVKFSAMPLAKR